MYIDVIIGICDYITFVLMLAALLYHVVYVEYYGKYVVKHN